MDVAFVLDASDGVTSEEFRQVLEVAETLTEKLRDSITDDDSGIRIASVSAARDSEVDFYLGRYRTSDEVIRYGFGRIRQRGGNCFLYDALQDVVGVFDRRRSRYAKMVIIISNGDNIQNTEEVLRQKNTMESSDKFYFFSVSLNLQDDYRYIQTLATRELYSTYETIVQRRDFDIFYEAANGACGRRK